MSRSASTVRPAIGRLTAALAIGTIASASYTGAQDTRPVAGMRDAAAASQQGARSLRILLAVSHDDAAAGASMGVAEVRRAAALLGHTIDATIQRVATGSSASATVAPRLGARRYDAIVGGETAHDCHAMAALARDARVVYVNAWCDDDTLRDATGPRCEGSQRVLSVLHVAPGGRMRDAAVAASRSSAGASSAGARSASADSASVLSARAEAAGAMRDRQAVAWHPSLERYGAAQVNNRYRLAYKRGMTERAWLGWAAVKLLADVALRPGFSHLGTALLEPRSLDGHKGRALRVRASDGQLLQPLYVIAAGTDTVVGSQIMAEIVNPVVPASSAGVPVVSTEARCE